jgi:hypothetical protein
MPLFSKLLNRSYPIVIAQYERDGFSAGSEEKLHWAIMVVTDTEELRGHIFQAIDRTYSNRPYPNTVWERSYRDPSASLLKTTKCVGIAQIGSVKARDLDTLIALVGDGDNSKGYQAVPRFEGWRCKDWVLEVVDLLRTHNPDWIDGTVVPLGKKTDRNMFYPALRLAGAATMQARRRNVRAPPAAQWL